MICKDSAKSKRISWTYEIENMYISLDSEIKDSIIKIRSEEVFVHLGHITVARGLHLTAEDSMFYVIFALEP